MPSHFRSKKQLSTAQLKFIDDLLEKRKRFYEHTKSLYVIDYDELKQNILIRIYTKLHLYDHKRPFEPWVKKLIYRSWINQIRNQIYQRKNQARSNYEYYLANYSREEPFFINGIRNISRRFFEKLSEFDRKIIDMRFDKKYTWREIGEKIGKTGRAANQHFNVRILPLVKRIEDSEVFWT